MNDTSATGDIYTSGNGADTQPGTSTEPFRCIQSAIDSAAIGDTIYIDAGLYDSYTIVNGSETAGVHISKDSITLVGKDSGATVINPPGSAATSGLFGIYADTQINLFIRNIGVTGANDGVRLVNVNYTTLSGDSFSGNGEFGLYLVNRSDTNTITNCQFVLNSNNGAYTISGSGNTFTGNIVTSNGSSGLAFSASTGNTLSANAVASSTLYGIYLQSSSNGNTLSGNIVSSNLQYGMHLNASSSNTLSGNTVNSNSDKGIYLSGGSSNTVSGNTAMFNSNVGIHLFSSASGNTVSSNTVDSNYAYGIYLQAGANSNLITGNTTNYNSQYGFYIRSSSNSNRIHGNMARGNSVTGFLIESSDTNDIHQNDISINDTGIWIQGTSSGNRIDKNIVTSNSSSNIRNQSASTQILTRNWWGSTDSVTINSKISDTFALVNYDPFRLGTVDTSTGADTTAPKAPDTVAVVNNDTSVILEWAAVTTNEETMAGGVALAGYKVYRSYAQDSSSWNLLATIASAGQIRYQDTGASAFTTAYYRVTAYDTASPYPNESFYSDSQPSGVISTTGQVNWYVNDTWVSGTTDSFTYAGGSDTSWGQGTVSRPFASIPKAMQYADTGDTIYIDAGLYDSYTIVNGSETVGVNIDKDSITLIGKDSGATVIDPPWPNSVTNLYGIFADSQTGLQIKNLGVTGAWNGIVFNNVDRSNISSDSVSSCAVSGILLNNGSDTNTVIDNTTISNSVYGIFLLSSSNNTVTNNTSNSNSQYGIYLADGSSNTVTSNTASFNSQYGIHLSSSSNNTVSGNTFNSNTNYGIYLTSSSNNAVTGNTANSNLDYGVYLEVSSNNNAMTGNTAKSNRYGIFLDVSSNNTVIRNTSSLNSEYGIYLASSSNNTMTQNDLNGNTKYQIYMNSACSSDTVYRNNIRTSATNPDSGVHNGSTVATNKYTFTRNWFGTADSVTIRRTIYQKSNGDSIIYQPYRLGTVDTSAGADTTAPDAPDTVAVVNNDTSVILEWAAVTTNEETMAGGVALAGYKVYRSTTQDSSSWNLLATIASAGQIRYQDLTASAFTTAYYRVTAYDTASPYPNESFYSDSQPSGAISTAGIVNWYVNDTSTSGDSYTTAIGSDAGGQGTASQPFAGIPKAMQYADIGDTIYIDAGLYDSYVVVSATETAGVHIDKDSITLIGKDSNATVIDPPGAKTVDGLYGIYADTQMILTIKNLGVTGARRGIYFVNVDQSTLTGDSVGSTSDGIVIESGSDSNTILGNWVSYNLFDGFGLGNLPGDPSTNNAVSGNIFSFNGNNGIRLGSWSGASTLIVDNSIHSNTQSGILSVSSRASVIRNNAIRSNLLSGIYLNATQVHTFVQNTLDSNAEYQIYISGNSYSDTFQKNNIKTSASNPDSGVFNSSSNTTNRFDLSRNYWNATDSSRIKQMIYQESTGDSILWQPYRLGAVDTAAGADTVAPSDPDTVAASATAGAGTVLVTWSAVTANEDGDLGTVGLTDYRIYRSTVADSSSWTLAGASAGTAFTDSGMTLNVTYYYRVTARDGATYPNESFYSDSVVSAKPTGFTKAVEPMGANAGVTASSIHWGDYDNDGDLDIAAAGFDAGSNYRLIVYRNNGGASFTNVAEPMGANAGVYYSSIRWGDYDNDGDLDLAVSGSYAGPGRLIIYRNNGGASFTNVAEPLGAGSGAYESSIEWGDYDNDGDLDLAVSGSAGGRRLIIYRNNGGDSFTNAAEPMGANVGVHFGSIQWGDYDNDGDLDLAVSGTPDGGSNDRLIIYRNNGGDSFTNVAEPLGANAGVYNSSVRWGDYDNDGDLDLAVSGYDGTNMRLIIYRNNGGDTFANVSEPMGANVGMYGGDVQWGDYDNDGDLDLAMSGATDYSSVNRRLLIYRNDGGASFTKAAEPMGVDTGVVGPVQWGDYDNDGDLDLAVSGSDGSFRRLIIYRNDGIATPNVRPGVPALNYPRGDTIAVGDSVTFRWTRVTGDTTPDTGMTYNLRVGTASGKCDVFAADTNSTDSVGNAVLGNVQTDTVAYLVKSLTVGQTYFWSVQAVDQGMMRGTWATEETFTVTMPSYSGPKWYVNDTSTSGDSFTYATGCDTAAANGSATYPWRTIIRAMAAASAGDTIYIDAGLYDSYVVVNGSETAGVNITVDSITLIGKDSGATVIDPPGAKTVSGLYGIYADTQVGLRVQNVGMTGAKYGIYFLDVDYSMVSSDSLCSNGTFGIYIGAGSDSNTLSGLMASYNSSRGVRIDGSSGNTLSGSTADTNTQDGVILVSSPGNTVSGNFCRSNGQYGITLSPGSGNTISNNTVDSNGSIGIFLSSSTNNMISGNSAAGNSSHGIGLQSNSDSNTVSGNTIRSNSQNGIFLSSTAVANVITGNMIVTNTAGGIQMQASSGGNRVRNNLIRSNTRFGVSLETNDNIFESNDIGGSDTGIYMLLSATGNFFSKNNITSNAVNHVYNKSGNLHTLTRNWFGYADSAAVKAKISDTASAWHPWRIGPVDTTAGADTTAPKAPDTVAVVNNDTSVILEWAAVTTNEETMAGGVALAGYKVYRSYAQDSSSWNLLGTVASNQIRFQDTGAAAFTTAYYRVTAYDTASPYPNESFYSDSQPSGVIATTGIVNWYVNDASTTGDIYTTATGSDVSGQGTVSQPFRTIIKAMQYATAGDTVFVDAGLYDSYVWVSTTETAGVNITVDSLTLVGKDSSATVIDPPGARTITTMYGIYADTQTGLIIRNIGVAGAYVGIYCYNIDLSIISQDSICGNTYGIMMAYSDTNTISNTTADTNGQGIMITTASASNTVSNNLARYNTSAGIRVSANGNTISGNTVTSNYPQGIYVQGCSYNTVVGNTSSLNYRGIYLSSASNNTVTGNVLMWNTEGLTLDMSTDNTISCNLTSENDTTAGVYVLANSDTNVFIQNESRGDRYAIFIDKGGLNPPAGNRFVRNNVLSPDSYGIYLATGQTGNNYFWRNYMDTTNTGDTIDNIITKRTLFGLIWDGLDKPGLTFVFDTQPRFAPVDTSTGGDSLAPGIPDTVTIVDTAGGILRVQWTPPTVNEVGEGTPGITGFRIYRSTNAAEKDWKGNTYLAARGSTDTQYLDLSVTNGVVYYYRVTAYDGAAFPNESYLSDSIAGVPGGTFSDIGSMTVYVSDQGNANQPTLDSAGAAFPNLDSAANVLSPNNGWDTIVVFSAKFSESYAIDDTAPNDTGRTLISKKALSGADAGGGGDTFAALRFYSSGGLGLGKMSDYSRVEGIVLDAGSTSTGGLTGVTVGSGVIIRYSEVRNAETGVHILAGTGVRIEGCTATNVNVGILNEGSTAIVKNCHISGVSGVGIATTGPGGTSLYSDNVIRGGRTGVEINGSGTDRLVRNTITDASGYGVYFATSFNVIQANDIVRCDTGIRAGGNNDSMRWNNIVGCTTTYVNEAIGSSSMNWWNNYFGTTDSGTITSKMNIGIPPYRYAMIDTKVSGDSIAPMRPETVTADVSTAGRVLVRWHPPATNEDNSAAAVNGYYVYRLTNTPDTTNWKAYSSLLSDTNYADTFLIDSSVTFGNTYYYCVSAYDAGTNEGFMAWPVSAIPVFSGSGGVRLLTAGLASTATYSARAMESVVVEVTDSDMNFNPAAINGLIISLVNATLGTETEIISCTELSANSGTFMGTVAISVTAADSTPQNGKLYVRAGDVIRASYLDSPSGSTVTDTALVIPPGVSSSNANIYLDQDQFMDQAGQQLDTDFLITVYDTQFEAVYGATVTFSVSFPSGSGASLSVSSTTTDTQGQARTRLTLGNLNDVYIVTASVNGLDSYFTAYADGVDVPAGEWIMWSPMRGPSTLAQLSGATSSMSFYEWDPSVSSGSNGSFSQYRTHSGNPSPNNATYTFSDFEPGEGYWVYNGGSAASFRPTGGALQADTGYFKVLQDDVSASSPWLQFGNPFPFWIDVERDIKVETDASGCQYTMEEADSAGILDRVVYWYDEDANNYVWGPKVSPSAVTGSGSNQGTAASENRVFLKPGVGFWSRVTSNNLCTFVFIPTKRTVEPDSVVILNQAPPLLSAGYKNRETKTSEAGWEIQFVASAGARKDVMNYAGVMPTAELAMQGSRFDPPAPAAGYVSLSIFDPQSEVSDLKSSPMAASYAPRSTDPKKVFAWPVEVRTDLAGQAVTITWDNVENLPTGFGAYLKTPEGEMIDMVKKPSTSFAGGATGVTMKAYTLYVGSAEALAAVLAAPLSKENTFAYPNPGPDAATGSVTFGYNLPAAADVKIKIFDVGGRLVRELGGAGTVGANTIVWDTTNRHGQKVGSGVYIYKIESGGEKLVDKLAIIR